MLTLPRAMVDEIIAHAREDDPNECCGIIAGNGGAAAKLYRAVNAEASPYRYNVDPKDLLRIYRDLDEQGWDVLVIYHSHTHTEA
jgi:proteasome lid subunit RPN8/RPN11